MLGAAFAPDPKSIASGKLIFILIFIQSKRMAFSCFLDIHLIQNTFSLLLWFELGD